MVVVKQENIEIRQKIQFATGKSKIRWRSFRLLKQVAQTLQAHPEIRIIRIEGHTDSRGRDVVNQRLSELRAQAVRRYLVKQGVDPERLVAVGYGESMPIASNRSRRGRMANRRVEFTIMQRGQ
jgi:outer membrane protein OmpA-like peptidoglycan-associated protein